MDAFTMAKVRIRLTKINGLRDGIEKETIAYKNCMKRRKSTVKCNIHKQNIQWAKSEIEELRDQAKVLYSEVGD